MLEYTSLYLVFSYIVNIHWPVVLGQTTVPAQAPGGPVKVLPIWCLSGPTESVLHPLQCYNEFIMNKYAFLINLNFSGVRNVFVD